MATQLRPVERDYSRAQTNAECRRDAALRDLTDWYLGERQKLSAEYEFRKAGIDRDFRSGRL
jgi:hypothetical protein